jgi:hypothetical protein
MAAWLSLLLLQFWRRIHDLAEDRHDFPSNRCDAGFQRETRHDLLESLFMPSTGLQVVADHGSVCAFLVLALQPVEGAPSNNATIRRIANTYQVMAATFFFRGDFRTTAEIPTRSGCSIRQSEQESNARTYRGLIFGGCPGSLRPPGGSGSWTALSIYLTDLRLLDFGTKL